VKTYQEIDDDTDRKKREAVTTTEPNLEVRLGAIYALERIAKESIRDHWPIMEVLCAYVRNSANSSLPIEIPKDIEPGTRKYSNWQSSDMKPPRVDIQAIITVIGRRSKAQLEYERKNETWLELSNANLQKADFARGNFCRVRFNGTRLEGASFHLSILESVAFFDAHLENAMFSLAILADASIWGAFCQGARFDNAKIKDGCNFYDAHFDRASLFGVDLSKSSGLTAVQISKAYGDASTILPDDLPRPDNWPNKIMRAFERWADRS
jgi:Pentapeptide repeats (8 copies)